MKVIEYQQIKPIMTTAEVASLMCVHPSTIRRYADEGDIPCVRIGRVYRYKGPDIEKWLTAGGRVTKKEKYNAWIKAGLADDRRKS